MKNPRSASKAPTWDLDSLFPGGSKSKEFAQFRETVKNDLKNAAGEFAGLPMMLDDASRGIWTDYMLKLQDIMLRLFHAAAFAECLVTQNVNDDKAHQIQGEVDVLISEFKKIFVSVEAFAKKQTDDGWKKFVTGDKLKEVQFFLDEVRDTARLKMDPEFEAMATDLAINGYHAWNRLYDKMYGDLRVIFTEKGKKKDLSLGQLSNRMTNPDRKIRKLAFQKLEEAWESKASMASMALNYQAGFRLTLYERRKWDSPLLEPLLNSRIKEETLNAMWSAISKSGPMIRKYINAKKKLLGIDGFTWYDQEAPVGASRKTYTFKEAGDFVVGRIGGFSKDQADFTRMALDKRWVEAEDRPGKAGGAFCTSLAYKKQSRVLMTFGGSFGSLSTLAHELGHAYHVWLLKDTPRFAALNPMTLAETASIFNEFLVTDAALEQAGDPKEKLMLLDQKLQNAYILFCNLHARFIFEKAFYSERKNSLVSRQRLDELMVNAQKQAFMGTLARDGYHPLFWASKLHFYLTEQPFYNFSYTFGYLFASGVYDRAKAEGPSFARNYQALLADTGKMTSEDVAKKHMGVDLTREDFWADAVNRVLADVEPFVKLAKKGK